MSKSGNQPSHAFLLLIILIVALLRLPMQATGSSLANFSPIGAMALFAGSYFKPWWKAILFPLLIVLIGDILINTLIYKGKYGILHNGWYWLYCIYISIVFIGQTLLKHRTVGRIGGAALFSSLLFWLVADFIVWAGGGTDLRTMLPLSRDFAGLLQCYIQGLPFALNFLLGTVFYSALLFGIGAMNSSTARTQPVTR